MRLIQEGEEAEGTEAEHFREVEVGERASGNKGGEILRKGVPGRKYGESSSCYRWKYKMTHPFSKAICQYALEMFRAFDPAVPVFEISLRKASRALLYLRVTFKFTDQPLGPAPLRHLPAPCLPTPTLALVPPNSLLSSLSAFLYLGTRNGLCLK